MKSGLEKKTGFTPFPLNFKESLAGQKEFWEHWGFEPWAWKTLAGVFRRQRFIKGGLLGRVAEFQAHEAIIWENGDAGTREELWAASRPRPQVMTQRFLFVFPAEEMPARRLRSFAFGFRGFLEFFSYLPGRRPHKNARDLSGLVDLALALKAPSPCNLR